MNYSVSTVPLIKELGVKLIFLTHLCIPQNVFLFSRVVRVVIPRTPPKAGPPRTTLPCLIVRLSLGIVFNSTARTYLPVFSMHNILKLCNS